MKESDKQICYPYRYGYLLQMVQSMENTLMIAINDELVADPVKVIREWVDKGLTSMIKSEVEMIGKEYGRDDR